MLDGAHSHGPHVYPPNHHNDTTLSRSATPMTAGKSPLSSPSPPPPPMRRSPRRSPSMAGPSKLRQVTKLKINRPKGASRKNLLDLVKWDLSLLEAIKVGSIRCCRISECLLTTIRMKHEHSLGPISTTSFLSESKMKGR